METSICLAGSASSRASGSSDIFEDTAGRWTHRAGAEDLEASGAGENEIEFQAIQHSNCTIYNIQKYAIYMLYILCIVSEFE